MKKKSRSRAALVRSTIVAALGGLLFGFDTVVISGCQDQLKEVFNLSEFWQGFMTAAALIGTVFGAMLAGIPGDRIGRRESLKWMAVLFFVSAVGCAMAWGFWPLAVFRFIGGLGVGGASVLGPMYLAEIAPAHLRGRLVGFFQFNVVLGILVAFLSNYVVGGFGLGEAEWRWKLGVEALPAILFFVMLFGIPRSPRWLVSRGNHQEARAVLERIGETEVERELQAIVRSLKGEHSRLGEPLFQKVYRFPIFLAVSIAMFNQLSGINGLLYYLNPIFKMAGFDKVSGDVQSVAIGATNLLFTMLAMSVIDRVGRKALLLIGSVGVTLALAGVAWIFHSSTNQGLLVWLLIGYIAFFGFSQGAVIWVYISEVFPNVVRAKGQALGGFTHWFMAAVVSFSFPLLARQAGEAHSVPGGSAATAMELRLDLPKNSNYELQARARSDTASAWQVEIDGEVLEERIERDATGSGFRWLNLKDYNLEAGSHELVVRSLEGSAVLDQIRLNRPRALPFAFFAAMMALQFIVVLMFYPETRGVPLEEMQRKLGISRAQGGRAGAGRAK